MGFLIYKRNYQTKMELNRFENYNEQNNLSNLDKITEMKNEYDNLISNYVNQSDASENIMRMSNGGYSIGEYGYPNVFFVGEYCLVLDGGSTIYKKV